MLDQVSGNDSPVAAAADRSPCGLDVRGGAGDGGGPRVDAAGEAAADDAAQHVAGAGGGERGRIEQAHAEPAVGVQHERVSALEERDRPRLLHELAHAAVFLSGAKATLRLSDEREEALVSAVAPMLTQWLAGVGMLRGRRVPT